MERAYRRILEHKVISAVAALVIVAGAARFWMRARASAQDLLTEPLRRGAIVESVYGIGTVTATRSLQLRFGVMSTVRQIFVREGDAVRRGQPLIEMDSGLRLSAPFAGTVTFLPVKVGETVFPQSILLSLVDLKDRYVVVSLEQRGALRVRQGQKAKISFDSMRGESFDGLVEAVYSNDNNFLVRIGAQDLPPQILPAMTADVAIGISEPRDALLVPMTAIDGGKVYVKRGLGPPDAVEIKIGVVDESMAEVLSGDLREGERLVIKKSPGGKR